MKQALIGIIMLTSLLSAQETIVLQAPVVKVVKETAPFTTVDYITIGGSFFDLDDVNESLETGYYPSLENGVVQVSLGRDIRFNQLVADYTLTGHWWKTGENSRHRTKLWGLDFSSSLGYDILEEKRFSLFPYVGLGIGGLFMKMAHRDVAFEDISDGTAPVDQSLNQLTLDIYTGLGFDVRSKSVGKGQVIGLKGGYRFDVSSGTNWLRNSSTVGGAPDLKASGPYFKVVLGIARDH